MSRDVVSACVRCVEAPVGGGAHIQYGPVTTAHTHTRAKCPGTLRSGFLIESKGEILSSENITYKTFQQQSIFLCMLKTKI